MEAPEPAGKKVKSPATKSKAKPKTVTTDAQSGYSAVIEWKSIEQLIKEDRLKDALDCFVQFLKECDKTNQELAQTYGRLAEVTARSMSRVVRDDSVQTERNHIRWSLLTQLSEFREDMLAKYFDIQGRKEFLSNITDRDQVIHEILDLRLKPKQYERDATWEKGKVEGNSSIIYRLLNHDTKRHAIAMVIKMPQIEVSMQDEIKRLTNLRHRNVIKLLDHEITKFPFFVITEYVYGESLPEALSIVGPRPVAQAADWLYQLADALDYLRHKRILHTNVRPSKIYIDDEWQIMISPFDLIKAPSPVPHDDDAVETDTSGETPSERTFNRYRDVCQYGSPELYARDGIGYRKALPMCISDMYSLGLIGYKILTGEDLFAGDRLYDILESRRRFEHDQTYRLEKLAKLPDHKLSDIIRSLLEKDIDARTQHYKNLRDLLHALNPLTLRSDMSGASEVYRSYRRCLASNRELINDFYERFLNKSPHAGDFDEVKRRRQSAMLQMAIDVLLDLDQKEKYLIKWVHPGNKKHAGYKAADFEMFLDTLIETLPDYDHLWNDTVRAAWMEVREKAMHIIRRERAKTVR